MPQATLVSDITLPSGNSVARNKIPLASETPRFDVRQQQAETDAAGAGHSAMRKRDGGVVASDGCRNRKRRVDQLLRPPVCRFRCDRPESRNASWRPAAPRRALDAEGTERMVRLPQFQQVERRARSG